MNDEVFLHERVDVMVRFDARSGCTPLKFRRPNGREITISEIGLRHPTTPGNRTVHIFDVTDDAADYRLEFDSERLAWQLTMEVDRE